MKEENKLYQLTCHLSPLLDSEKIEGIVQKIKGWVVANDGVILADKELSVDNIKKINLAYPIKKYNESFYLNFGFLANNQGVEKINNQLNLEKNIIRHMLVSKKKPTSISKEIIDYKASEEMESLSRPKEDKQPVEITEKPAEVEKKPAADKKEKIKIEELDQKLEEILSQ